MSRYSIPVVVRPISTYPVPETRQRERSRFKAPIGETMQELDRELRMVGARQVVIEADFCESQIRIADGWPKADARPATPRVVLSFTHPVAGGLRYPCDTYLSWTENLRAIVHCLEALRAVERHGVVRKAEQYAGWKALPSSGTATMDVHQAAERVAFWTDARPLELLKSAVLCAELIRAAQKRTHPDAGGTAAAFQQVQEAAKVLRAHHGVSA